MGMNAEDNDIDLGILMPVEVSGWKAAEVDSIYDPESIFEYINGAGEVYRAYDFKKLQARHFQKEGQPKIFCDLFDMSEARNAFGVFTYNIEGEDVRLGQGSLYSGGLLSFWKHRYFVSIFAEEETAETRAAVLAIGGRIDESIKEKGAIPEVVSLLPQENLEKESVRYFHHYLILNYHFFVADENIFLLDSEADAVLGTFTDKSKLLVVHYHDENKTAEAYKSFTQAYMPDASEAGLVQTEDNRWVMASVKEGHLIVVFDAPSEGLAKKRVSAVKIPD